MSFLRWSLRCIPGLSTFCLLILLESALKIVQTEWLSFFYPPFLKHVATPLVAQTLFIVYSIFLHILALLFPLRLCMSAYTATKEINAIHQQPRAVSREVVQANILEYGNGEQDSQQDGAQKTGRVTIAVVLPSYKEDIEILETSLRVLASHALAKTTYDVGHVL